MSLVENIKRLCKKAGTSIPKLGTELGFGNGALYNWDKNSPSIDKLQKVAAFFNTSVDSILSGELSQVNPDSTEVIDICANPECNSEIYFGQPVFKIGHDLVCSGKCLMKMLGAKTVIAGKEVNDEATGEDSAIDC